ncbi:uncharacterized protein LOC116307263 [Actinia tenebrosa]|uniref:Uncharacterized protein LOC116307263 n=1 Tax=Actinia tenebrosa TaxID=6105 RepID=A0A6P8J5W2_ACTTE|nr:uncharacterized protein LOC116307263 [Actinia tenebrosa]
MLEGTKDRIERIRFLRRIDANEAFRQDLHAANARLLKQNLSMSEKIIKLQEQIQATQKKTEDQNTRYYYMKKRLQHEEREKLAFVRKNVELKDTIKDFQHQLQEELIKNAKLDARVNQALELLEKDRQSSLRKSLRSIRQWLRGILHC